MIVSIIAAIDEKMGLGKNNDLLFKIPEDFKRFRTLTSGRPIIMGRKTYESIGKPLPNRTNIVVTRDPSFLKKHHKISHCSNCDEIVLCNSLEEALRQAQGKPGDNEVFIIGGGQIFEQALPLADKLYLTIVEGEYDADTFFPEYSSIFTKVVSEEKKEADGYKYTFLDLEK